MPDSLDPDGWAQADLAGLLRALRDADPGAPIVADGADGALDREGFWRLACGVSHAAVGCPGSAFGLLPPHGAMGQAWLAGALLAGRPFALLDPRDPPARTAEIAEALGLATLLAGPGTTPPDGLALLPSPGEADHPTQVAAGPDAPAIIVPTSGSTGRPKGVVHCRRALLFRVRQLADEFAFAPGSVYLSTAASGSISGVVHGFAGLLSGALLLRVDTARLGLARTLAAAERAGGVTAMQGLPATLCALLTVPGAGALLAGVRRCQSSGAALLAADVQALRAALPATCQLVNVYGLTEAPAILRWDVPAGWLPDGSRIPAGQPLEGQGVALLDEDGAPVPAGEVGELVARGPNIALGEWRDGGLVDSPRIAPGGPGERVLRTGDLARRRADHLIEIVGRADRQVKVAGRRVELEEIEDRLRRIEGVAEAAVLADRDVPHGPRIYAAVAGKVDAPADLAERLKRELRVALPGYMQPSRLEVWPALPRLPGGKVDHATVLARLRATRQAPAAVPADPRVARAWKRVLGAPPRDGMSFHDAGGDSLAFLNFALELERTTGHPAAMSVVQGDMTAAEVAEALAAPLARGSGPRVLLLPGIHGDLEGLARQRECCSELDMVVARFLSWRDLARGGAEVEVDAKALLPLALALFGEDRPPILAGYSYGAAVAHALAGLLATRGRPVLRILLLDPGGLDLNGENNAPAGVVAPARSSLRGGWWDQLRWRFRWAGADPRRAWIAAQLLPEAPPSGRRAGILWRDLEFGLRHEAMLRWARRQPPPHDVPAVLLLSGHPWRGVPPEIDWRRRCDLRAVVPIGGDHSTMIHPQHRAGLAAAMTAEVLESAAEA